MLISELSKELSVVKLQNRQLVDEVNQNKILIEQKLENSMRPNEKDKTINKLMNELQNK